MYRTMLCMYISMERKFANDLLGQCMLSNHIMQGASSSLAEQAYFDVINHTALGLVYSLAIATTVETCSLAAKEQDMRGHLGSFGIKGALATHKMSQLSGGQAVRVGLAAVTYAEPHLLILVCLSKSLTCTDCARQALAHARKSWLTYAQTGVKFFKNRAHVRYEHLCSWCTDFNLQDEPTAHLDMQSIDALQACLQGYAGGIVLVTHDQHFCSSIAEQVWLLLISAHLGCLCCQ